MSVGRLSAVAVDPSNAAHLLVGAAGGGVWESFDSGATWSPRTDGAPTLTVGAVAFDPAQPATVFVGTGEGNWYSRWGAGVLRSTDGGTTFALLAGPPFVGQGFFDLIVDPTRSNRLFAATTGGRVPVDGRRLDMDQPRRGRVLGPVGGQARQSGRGARGVCRRHPPLGQWWQQLFQGDAARRSRQLGSAGRVACSVAGRDRPRLGRFRFDGVPVPPRRERRELDGPDRSCARHEPGVVRLVPRRRAEQSGPSSISARSTSTKACPQRERHLHLDEHRRAQYRATPSIPISTPSPLRRTIRT